MENKLFISDTGVGPDGYKNIKLNDVSQEIKGKYDEVILSCIDKIHPNQAQQYLSYVVSLAKLGGVVSVGTVDVLEFVSKYNSGMCSELEMVQSIYSSVFSYTPIIIDMMTENNIDFQIAFYSNDRYFVKGVRE